MVGEAGGATAGAVTRRAERRAETVAEIKSLARQQLAENGTGGLSLRGIAREMRMSPAAIFRYFESQAALITALCVDAYNSMADSIHAAQDAGGPDPSRRWRAICGAARSWALANPSDFALINGTPIPGYHAAPEETGPAAGRIIATVASAYLSAIAAGAADPARSDVPPLAAGPLLVSMVADTELSDSPVPGVIINAWSSILGFLASEIFGSLRALVADPDTLFEAHVTTVMRGMGYEAVL
ncbi:TetR/AcrR family transcriptional regulator [Nocardia yunnanensis]|uniref:TetR/AcrR family transcriptional regulator n=1 Tax=Nocardia yunnanensis TaxID=2382165 RepID=A0A386ZHM5_9NOCA|nr:TetR/AcrR family transcriptional regulator [Nocardia yunnanensis]AYF76890.1 TetR/AcrR family transcriptional regulator [Nocardia yunnanensis]